MVLLKVFQYKNMLVSIRARQRSLPFEPKTFIPPHSRSSRPLHYSPALPLVGHLHPRVSTESCIAIIEMSNLQLGAAPPFWNADRPLWTCAILASCSVLLMGLFFFRVGAALDATGAGRAGASSACGACFRTKTSNLWRTSSDNSSISSSSSSSCTPCF